MKKSKKMIFETICEVLIISIYVAILLVVLTLMQNTHMNTENETIVYYGKFIEEPTIETLTEPIVENIVENVENHKIKTTTETYTEQEMLITAYCPCVKCCDKDDGITASGTRATQGRTVAVDPRYIPYGTEVIIDGVTYIAEDCGGAIKGDDRIDLYFNSHIDALNFGKQTKIVRIEK